MDPGIFFKLIGALTFSQPLIMTTLFGVLIITGVIVGLQRPVYSIILYFCIAITNPQVTYPILSALPLAKIAAGVSLLTCIINSGNLQFRFPKLVIPFYIFLFFSILASLTAVNPDLASKRFSEFNEIGLMIILVIWSVKTREDYTLLFYGVLGCFWYAVLKSLVETQTHGRWYAIQGTGGWIKDSNDWALALAMAIPLFYTAFMLQKKMKFKIFHGLSFLSAILVLTLTSSRGGFLGAAIACSFLLITERNKKFAFSAIAVLLFTISIYMPQSYSNQILSILKSKSQATSYWNEDFSEEDSNYSGAERVYNWRIAYEMMKDHPFSGVGWGNYVPMRAQYESDPGDTVVHSTWFQIAAEAGIIALSFYIMCVFLSLTTLFKTYRRALGTKNYWLALHSRTLLAGIAAFCISGSFVSRENCELLFLFIAMTACLTFLSKETKDYDACLKRKA